MKYEHGEKSTLFMKPRGNVTSLFNKRNFVDTPPRLIQTRAVSFRLRNDHWRLMARLGKFFFLLYFNNSLSLNFSLCLFIRS